MKTARIIIGKWLDKQDKSWRALPLDRQHNYTRCFFLAYLLLTAAVLLKAWHGMEKSENRMVVDPIESPVRKKESPASRLDTLSTIFKEKIHERK